MMPSWFADAKERSPAEGPLLGWGWGTRRQHDSVIMFWAPIK